MGEPARGRAQGKAIGCQAARAPADCAPAPRTHPPPPPPQGPRTNANTKLYVNQLYALAQKYGAPVVDIFGTWPSTAGWADKYLNPDKLHLNGGGWRGGVGGG